jgi:hypothetical protein
MADNQDNQGWRVDHGEALRTTRRPSGRAGSSRRFLFVIAVLVVGSAVIARFLWGFMRSEAFPKLPPGRYAGQFSGFAEFSGARDWMLTISDDYKKIEAVFLGGDDRGYPAQRNGSGYLVIQAGEQNLILKGSSGDQATPHGELQVEGSKRSGEWSLAPLKVEPFEADQAFRHWIMLRAEIARLERDTAVAEQLVPAQKAEIEELGQLITDVSAMKDRGAKRTQELQEQVLENEVALGKINKETVTAENQLRLAQKVTVKGKLVALARDSLDRETRWARSLTAGSAGAVSGDLENALQKAEEVAALKDALAVESATVEQLAKELEAQGEL